MDFSEHLRTVQLLATCHGAMKVNSDHFFGLFGNAFQLLDKKVFFDLNMFL